VAFSCAYHLAPFLPDCAMQCVSSARHFHGRVGAASYVTAGGHGRVCVGNPAPAVTEEGPGQRIRELDD
jgi:hypothetical protein